MDALIKRINSGERLDYNEARLVFSGMIEGSFTESQIASTLISMRFRGETVEEMAALISSLDSCKKKLIHSRKKSIDTCGTGGDGKSTVNVSTACSIILASMGYTVFKHGNSAQSGKVGSADILKAIGLDIDEMSRSGEDFLEKHNFIFMFAPHYHPALGGIGKVRRELKVSTIFNLAGPLVNPADPEYQVIGINSREKLKFVGNVIRKLGRSNITVYSSFDGFDEVSSHMKTECVTVRNDRDYSMVIDPADFFEPFEMPVVRDEEDALKLFMAGMTGRDQKVAKLFALNTALALYTMEECSMADGYQLTMNQIVNGRAAEKLKEISGVH